MHVTFTLVLAFVFHRLQQRGLSSDDTLTTILQGESPHVSSLCQFLLTQRPDKMPSSPSDRPDVANPVPSQTHAQTQARTVTVFSSDICVLNVVYYYCSKSDFVINKIYVCVLKSVKNSLRLFNASVLFNLWTTFAHWRRLSWTLRNNWIFYCYFLTYRLPRKKQSYAYYVRLVRCLHRSRSQNFWI